MKAFLLLMVVVSDNNFRVIQKLETPGPEACVLMSERINNDSSTPMVAGCFYFAAKPTL